MVERQFRLSVLAVALVLIASITYLRFCGSVSLPPKPAPPTGPTGTQQQLLSQSTTSPTIYSGFLQSDAARAGVRASTIEEMSKKLPYRADDARHVLSAEPIEVAGLRLHTERSGADLVMVIENRLGSDVAYHIVANPSASCAPPTLLPINAIVIAKAATERRSECRWRDNLSIIVTKVEAIEVSPLSAWYIGQLPPSILGIEERYARAHRGPEGPEKCSPVLSQVVRTGLEKGEIGWRDLVDFYSRHRCQTYPFPSTYRAFTRDNERSVPSTGS